MQKKFVNFDVKAESEDRVISGYGSVFGNEDLGGDVVQAGAFSESIASGRKVKMLWQHDPSQPIGIWTSVSEDERGLKIAGRLADTPKGNEIYQLLKIGAIDGLSIGYATKEWRWNDETRIIEKADLWEVSVVTC